MIPKHEVCFSRFVGFNKEKQAHRCVFGASTFKGQSLLMEKVPSDWFQPLEPLSHNDPCRVTVLLGVSFCPCCAGCARTCGWTQCYECSPGFSEVLSTAVLVCASQVLIAELLLSLVHRWGTNVRRDSDRSDHNFGCCFSTPLMWLSEQLALFKNDICKRWF